MSLNINSNSYIIGFAATVCIVCSLFVSGAAVSLKEKQKENQTLDLNKNIISVSGLVKVPKGKQPKDIIDGYSADKISSFFKEGPQFIDPKTIDIETGKFVDISTEEKDKANKKCIKAEQIVNNTAKISCLAKYHDVYVIMQNNSVTRYVLPVVGKGLWSTLKGFAAVDSNGQQVVGLTFYSHGETPGLGGEIDSTKFKEDWASGKTIYSGDKVALKVAKGPAKDKASQVDGLSGATLTGNGVSGMMSFWFGEHGYKNFLKTGGK